MLARALACRASFDWQTGTRPTDHSAAQVCGLISGRDQMAGCRTAAVARTADTDDLAITRQFLHPLGKFAKRNELGVGNVPFTVFVRLADVKKIGLGIGRKFRLRGGGIELRDRRSEER